MSTYSQKREQAYDLSSLPTQGLPAVGHSRSQLGKSLTAAFPRKSSELVYLEAYSLPQHLLKALFSVKCLMRW